MAQVIKAAVTSDPFAPGYGLEVAEFPYHEEWTLRQYIEANFNQPEEIDVYVNLLRPESWDVILTPDDGLLIGNGLGAEGAIGAIAAGLAKLFTAWGAGVSVSAVGAGAVAAGVGVSVGA